MYLPETARLTVVSCTPTTSATCAIVMRLEMRDAFFHELALALDDFPADVRNGLLPLVQALDEKFSGADFFADVIFHLGVVFARRTSNPCRHC